MHSGVLPVTYRKVDKVHLPNSLSIGAPKMNLDVGSVELELDIKPEFSPKMSILAYYIRGDKEVVTAVLDLEVDSCFPNPVYIVDIKSDSLMHHIHFFINQLKTSSGQVFLGLQKETTRSKCVISFEKWCRFHLWLLCC